MNLSIETASHHNNNAVALFRDKFRDYNDRLVGVIPCPFSHAIKDYSQELDILLLSDEIVPPQGLNIHLTQGVDEFVEFQIPASENNISKVFYRLEFTRIVLPTEIGL